MNQKILELISSIVINIFSSQLYDNKASIVERINLRIFRKKIIKWVREYIIKHEGTVLTTGDFEIFLSRYRLIENIFTHVSDSGNSVSKEEFIKNQINLFHRIQAHPENNRFDTNDILREFITYFYDAIDSFFFKHLSQNEKYLISKIEKGHTTILEKIRESDKQVNNNFDKVIDYLKNQSKINDSELVFLIFQKISSKLFDGEVYEILDIWPLLVGKSNDLEISVAYLLNLLSEKPPIYVDFNVIQNDVEDDRIYKQVCRISIYVNMWRNNTNNIKKVSNRTIELRHIVQSLLDDRHEDFYILEESKLQDIPCFTYKLQNNYPTEQWLVKRICLLDISNSSFTRSSDIMKKLIESPDNIIDKIIILKSEILEMYSKTNNDLAKKIYNDAYRLIENTNNISQDIKVDIFEILLRSALIVSIEKARKISAIIPEDINEIKNIKLLLLQIKMQTQTVHFDELIKVCMKYEEYWLFYNYIIENMHIDPSKMKKLIEKYKFVIDFEPSIFFIYVQLVKKYDESGKAVELLKEYKYKYGVFLEFWIETLRIEFDEDKLDDIITEYKDGKLKSIFNSGLLELIKIMIHYKRYENVLEIIHKQEFVGKITSDLLKYKAVALSNINHEIESLLIFEKLFKDGNHSEEIVYNIIGLSLNNKRNISQEVLEYAEKSEDTQVLILVANVYIIEKDLNKAISINLKAMLRTTNNNSKVFNQYLYIETLTTDSKESKIQRVDIGTAIKLIDCEDCTERQYVIHLSNILPKEPYVWEEAIHIYQERAIMLDLLRHKIGDTITIDSHSYKIEEILPIEVYFFRLSMKKVINNGEAKMINMPITENGDIDTKKFSESIKKVLGENKNHTTWLNQYENIKKIPLTFYFGQHFFRLTYFQLISTILKDQAVLYRETKEATLEQQGDYIFSYAALVVLYTLGWKQIKCKEKYGIPNAMSKVVNEEKRIIINQSNKDNTSYMGFSHDQFYIIESSEEEKRKSMQEIVRFKEYCDQFITIDNDCDFCLKDEKNINIKDILGIVDYDSVSIAKKTGRILVSAEVIVSAICHMQEINVFAVGIADFLAKESDNCDELLIYVRKMVEYRFMIPFTINTISCILDFYQKACEKEKKSIVERWIDILELSTKDEKYKDVMVDHIQHCIGQLNNKNFLFTPIGKSLLVYWSDYSGRKISFTTTEDGKFNV